MPPSRYFAPVIDGIERGLPEPRSMASKTKSKRRKPSAKKPAGRRVSEQRRKEILGLILMALALLLSLALVTYDAADDKIAGTFSLKALLQPGGNRAANALGLLGAVLARALVPGFLGYTTLLLTGLLFAWGYVIFRHQRTVYLPLLSVLTAAGALVLATFLGWFGVSEVWSGTVGASLAGWMRQVSGGVGSFVILLVLVLVTLLLVIDHDIQRSLDRVEELLKAAHGRFASWRATQKERAVARRETRARHREERMAQRAESLRERERRKKQATIEYYSNIRTGWRDVMADVDTLIGRDVMTVAEAKKLVLSSPEDEPSQFKALLSIRSYLSTLEWIAAGARAEVYDKEMLYWLGAGHFMRAFNRYRSYISVVREMQNRPTVYEHLEWIADEFKDMQAPTPRNPAIRFS